MPLDRLHHQVAVVALRAAAGYGFALGGGNALIAHGVISRATQDVDLFTDDEAGVGAAAGLVEDALRGAGFDAERVDLVGGLAEVFEGMGEGLAEWVVTAPGGEQMVLQMAYFDRAADPASRAEPRDYIDIAAVLGQHDPDDVIGWARRLDPGLEDRDFGDAGRRLDKWGDGVFAAFGLSPGEIAALRERFASWPRN